MCALWIAALMLPLAACGGSSKGQSPTIVLDHSIGPVSLLEPIHDVESTLGKGMTIHNDKHYGHYVRYAELGSTSPTLPARSMKSRSPS